VIPPSSERIHSQAQALKRQRRISAHATQLLLAILGVLAGCEGLGFDASVAGERDTRSEQLVAGLKEVLRVGAERSVARASRPGGFLDDPRIRIPLPGPLRSVGQGLRAVGFPGTVDEVEIAMNRAAEKASGKAMPLLDAAIESLEIEDAAAIARGPGDAATRYFRSHTESDLRARFAPGVEAATRSAGLYRAYDELLERNRVLELLAEPEVDLDRYVTDKTLDGLFTLIGEEEKRIRTQPAARTTDLLRRMFGSSGGS
jgi:Protein of unknown function (DUF4197)